MKAAEGILGDEVKTGQQGWQRNVSSRKGEGWLFKTEDSYLQQCSDMIDKQENKNVLNVFGAFYIRDVMNHYINKENKVFCSYIELI